MAVHGINGKDPNKNNCMRRLKMKSLNGNLLQSVDWMLTDIHGPEMSDNGNIN